jgi:hypothetical protein
LDSQVLDAVEVIKEGQRVLPELEHPLRVPRTDE